MPSRLNLTFRDFDKEGSTVIFKGAEWTELNFATRTAEIDALRAATEAVSLGVVTKEVRIVDYTDYMYTQPANEAQRESKWLVGFSDTVNGKKYTVEIPCADLALLDTNHPKEIDYSSTEYIDFAVAFQAYVLSPDGNAVDINYMRHVGRNN